MILAITVVVAFCVGRAGRSCWKTLPWYGRPPSGPSPAWLEHLERARPYLGTHGFAGYVSDADFGGSTPVMQAYAAQYVLLPILLRPPVAGEPTVATLVQPGSLERARAAGYDVVADLGDGLWVLRPSP